MTTPEQLAYFAGFFDGEGCVLISRARQRKNRNVVQYRLCVMIGNTNPVVIQEIQENYGGSICGFQPKNRKSKFAHQWRANGAVALKFLSDILPYLKIKKQVALVGIHFQTKKIKCNNNGVPEKEIRFREFCVQKAKRLNLRGCLTSDPEKWNDNYKFGD